jgi:adenine-specific DNA-methyltransferase
VVYARDADRWKPELLARTEEANARYENIDNDPRGPWKPSDLTARNFYGAGTYEVTSPSGKVFKSGIGRYWRQSYEKFKEMEADGRIWWGSHGSNMPAQKRFLSEVKQGMVPQTLWMYSDVGHTQEAKKELLEFVPFENTDNVLDSVKPTRLIQKMIQLATAPHSKDIVLDFFGGSGTAGHAVLKQNLEDGGARSFICVQLPEPLPVPESRLKTLADITKQRLQNVSQSINQNSSSRLSFSKSNDGFAGFKVMKLAASNFKQWQPEGQQSDVQALSSQLELHVDHTRGDRTTEDLLYETLIKSGFPLSTEIQVEHHGPATIYSVAEGVMVICLERSLEEETIRTIANKLPQRVVCLDEGFAGNDQLKTNTVQLMKSKGIVFRTI